MANNLIYTQAEGNRLALIAGDGPVYGYRNWFKPGWKVNRSKMNSDANLSGFIEGADPGFNAPEHDDYRLKPESECIEAGAYLKTALVPDHAVKYQYVPGGKGMRRTRNGQPNQGRPDVGAYEEAVALE